MKVITNTPLKRKKLRLRRIILVWSISNSSQYNKKILSVKLWRGFVMQLIPPKFGSDVDQFKCLEKLSPFEGN
jgi:hypothetical protein